MKIPAANTQTRQPPSDLQLQYQARVTGLLDKDVVSLLEKDAVSLLREPGTDAIKALYISLLQDLQKYRRNDPKDEKEPGKVRTTWRQVFPRIRYPMNLYNDDVTCFQEYWPCIDKLDVAPDATEASATNQGAIAEPVTNTGEDSPQTNHDPTDASGIQPGAIAGPSATKSPSSPEDKNASPTLLSVSQKIYDAEVTRRDSINSRWTAVLSTAGILGTIVVAAAQIGLIRHSGSFEPIAWPILIFFLISLAYLGGSIAIALSVHGDIQGEVIDGCNLWAGGPVLSLNQYNLNVAKTELLYANLNWCLNNRFKYRLQSAQRCLRNGVIATIIAGALSPWAVTSSTGALPQTTPLIATHATASVRPFPHAVIMD